MRVLKFGGTSVADAAAIRRAVAIIAGRQGARTVVVSALAGVTDALLAVAGTAAHDPEGALHMIDALAERHRVAAHGIGALLPRRLLEAAAVDIARDASRAVTAINSAGGATPALTDRLLAAGELWSSRIVAAFVADAGIASQWIDARHVIRTSDRHTEAVPDVAAIEAAVARHVRPVLAVDRVAILAGFIGSSPTGATTTLGRGGSDYSAALVGAALDADEIEIWTDVDGVLSADPRVVAGARVLPTLSYDDAATLARFGAKVLHPKTMEPAAARGIPVRVLNSRRPDQPGTRIDSFGAGDGAYAAVASRAGVSLVEMTAREKGSDGSFAARALGALMNEGVALVIGEVHGDRVLAAIDRPIDLEAFRARVATFAEVRRRDGLAAVCAVGDRLASDPGVATGAFGMLRDGPVHLVSRPGGSAAFAVIVDGHDAHPLVARLHDWFTTSNVAAGVQ